jgi:pSer/pThr/pTyr-binding forkhead associated (FHA) protein
VSKVHFRVYSVIYDDDNMTEYPPLLFCEDRQSSNGTYVNDILIGTYTSPRSPYLLNDGDVISIRPHWTFQFHQTKQANGRRSDNLQAQEIEVFFLSLFSSSII